MKQAAHNAVAKALLHGKMVKRPCAVCGSLDSEAHHDDYSKPLDVRWLCDLHHKEVHRQEKLDAQERRDQQPQ